MVPVSSIPAHTGQAITLNLKQPSKINIRGKKVRICLREYYTDPRIRICLREYYTDPYYTDPRI